MEEFSELIQSEFWSIIFGGISGFLVAWFSRRFFNKRGAFDYFVQHNKVGMSADDPVFGRVEVRWNDNPIEHLFISTVTLKNESLNDYSNVVIQAYTTDTRLLTESTHIIGTPSNFRWTDSYADRLEVADGARPSDIQYDIYHGQREYLVPVLNRGQEVKISYLNAARSEGMPHIWLSAAVKGVKVRFRVPREEVWGVPRPIAVVSGFFLGVILLLAAVPFLDITALYALPAVVFGVFVAFPGALLVKIYQRIRDLVGG